MTPVALLSPDATFEARVRAAEPTAEITRCWREEHLRIDPSKVVEELLEGGAGVACLGPGLPIDELSDDVGMTRVLGGLGDGPLI